MRKTIQSVAIIAALVAFPTTGMAQMSNGSSMGMSKGKSSMMKKKKRMMKSGGTMTGSGNSAHSNGGNGPGGRY